MRLPALVLSFVSSLAGAGSWSLFPVLAGAHVWWNKNVHIIKANIPIRTWTKIQTIWQTIGINMKTNTIMKPDKFDVGWNVNCFIASLLFFQLQQTVKKTYIAKPSKWSTNLKKHFSRKIF